MSTFDDGIRKMLWPERRVRDSELGDKVPGTIDRVTEQSYLIIPRGFQPDILVRLLTPLRDDLPWLFAPDGDIELGPIMRSEEPHRMTAAAKPKLMTINSQVIIPRIAARKINLGSLSGQICG